MITSNRLKQVASEYFPVIEKLVLAAFVIQSVLLLITFFKWGPTFNSDTLSYFHLANEIKSGHYPYSPSYSPGYPFLVACISIIFSVNLESSAFIAALLFYGSSIGLVYLIVRFLLTGRVSSWLQIVFALMIVNSWWSVMIIFKAHADGLFYIFHLLVFLTLIQFLRTEKFIWYVTACLMGAVAIWVKYNSLIYVPFLAVVPLLFYGWNKKVFMGILPVVISGLSFLLFKTLNGRVIKHLETTEQSSQLRQDWMSVDTLFTNLADSGRVLIGGLFSDFVANRIPKYLLMSVVIVFLVSVAFMVITRFGKRDVTVALMVFIAGYILGFGLLSQLSNHTEMTFRTLFSPLIILQIALFYGIIKEQFKPGYIVIAVILFLQPIRMVAGTLDWYRSAPMDSFVLAKQFGEKESLIRLGELMSQKDIEPENVYTNQLRYLVINLDYQMAKRIPMEEQFIRGKRRLIEDEKLITQRTGFINLIKSGKILVVLFNADVNEFEWLTVTPDIYVEKIGRDIIVYY